MESSPQEDGGQFYWALGALDFHLLTGGRIQMRSKHFLHSFFLGGDDKGQILLNFVCLFLVKLKISKYFFQGGIMTLKI